MDHLSPTRVCALLVFCTFCPLPKLALAQCQSNATGDWDVAGTWTSCGGSFPTVGDDVVIRSPHTVMLTADDQGADNITIDIGGTLDDAAFDLLVGVDLLVNGTVNLDGRGSIGDVLTVNGTVDDAGGRYTVGGNLVVDGTFNNIGGRHTVGGNLVVDGTFTSTGRMTFTGVGKTIDGTGSISISDRWTFNQDMTILATANFNITGAGRFNGAGELTNNGTITTALRIQTDWVNALNAIMNYSGTQFQGALDAAATDNLFNYNRSGAQNVVAPSTSYYDLTLAGSGTKTILGATQVDGDLTVSGTATVDATTNLTTVTLGGSVAQTVTGAITFYGLTVNNTFGTVPQIINNNDITITNTLTLTDGVVQSAGIVIIQSAATSTGTSAASYVDGVVRKSGNTDFIFPAGDGSVWARAEATSISNADAILEVQYFDAAYSDVTTIDPASSPALNNVSKLEYWEISENSGNNRTAILRLYWEDDSRSQITDVTDLSIAKFDVSLTPDAWTNVGTGYTGTDNGDGTGNVVSTGSVSFASPITFGSILGNNALPVELVSFQGVLQQSGIRLNWVTAQEINNDFFEVQTSLDAETFVTLAKIPGQGTISVFSEYEYLHRNPVSGLSYYRLRQVDYDGTESFSRIISVNNDRPERLSVSVYPNPAIDKLKLIINSINDGGIVELNIYGTQGTIIKSVHLGETLIDPELDVSTLSTGVYIIRARQGIYAAQTRFVIDR